MLKSVFQSLAFRQPNHFEVNILISFEYLGPYSLIPIKQTYIFTNIVEATEPGAKDPKLGSELHNIVFRF